MPSNDVDKTLIEYLLFTVTSNSWPEFVKLVYPEYCTPLACSMPMARDTRYKGFVEAVEMGLIGLWSSIRMNSKSRLEQDTEFIKSLGLDDLLNKKQKEENMRPRGLYVYKITYDLESIDDIDMSIDDFCHLRNGSIRRPKIKELKPFTQDSMAPWGGVIL